MKTNYEKMTQNIVKSIDWNKIKYFHQVFGIKWQFEEKDGHLIERFPTISELKDELRTLLIFVVTKNIKTFDYSNWIILWINEEDAQADGLSGAKLEAIFSLENCFVLDNDPDVDTLLLLENKLESAIKNEKYEEAAKLRDKINAKKNLTK